MTRAEAVATAQGAATRFAKPFVIYRLPAWPPDAFGVVSLERGLPPQADIIEQLDPFEPQRTRPATEPPQGSLF